MIRPKLVCFLMIASALPLYAQLVSVKTVPVVTGDQFVLYPSQNMAMGNVRYINPALKTGDKTFEKLRVFTNQLTLSVSF